MARNIDPVCKLCRREGIKLFLKGSRCESPKCAIERRNSAPGMHGYRRGKQSEYGVRLREKQKLKRFYGVLEKQFRRYFELASRSPENTGEMLLSIMERRLDNVIHRLGLAPSRAAARVLVSHGHFLVNGRPANIPSMLLKQGDMVKAASRPRSLQLIKLNQQDNPQPIPDFLEMIANDPPEARMVRLPTRTDVDPRLTREKELREQLIIEFCSR
ncbi:MAG: 30S ribosomal protein S4 [Gemmataceae bacterium]|nr:30S ribosomal protein S4 [Gemmataceae bacterium]